MVRTLSPALLAAQQVTSRTSAVRVLINGVDYSSRVLFIEHHEEPYRDYASILLQNNDRGLDKVSTLATNLLGYRFRIAYGYFTGRIVAEPNGDGSGNEYVETADLWVKAQKMISSEGQLECELYCEGQWMYLREQLLTVQADQVVIANPTNKEDEGFLGDTFNGTKTVYQLIQSVIVNAMGWTLNAFPGAQDYIINSFYPVYTLRPMASAAAVLADDEMSLIKMTKCYLRAKANRIWEIVYPQSSDPVDRTFYSDQAPYFYEFAETINLITPNRVIVIANDPNDKYRTLGAWPQPIMIGDTGAYNATHPGQPDGGHYDEVLEAELAPTITIQEDADNRAEARLVRKKSESRAGYLITSHDCSIELYDKVEVEDQRGH